MVDVGLLKRRFYLRLRLKFLTQYVLDSNAPEDVLSVSDALSTCFMKDSTRFYVRITPDMSTTAFPIGTIADLGDESYFFDGQNWNEIGGTKVRSTSGLVGGTAFVRS